MELNPAGELATVAVASGIGEFAGMDSGNVFVRAPSPGGDSLDREEAAVDMVERERRLD